MQVLTHLVFYKIILVCVYSVYFLVIPTLLDRYSLIRIYFAFIRPVLEYGDAVWGNCTKKESDLLESVQIEAGRIITGRRCNSSRQKLYRELGKIYTYKGIYI
jgi:hypothetical protein